MIISRIKCEPEARPEARRSVKNVEIIISMTYFNFSTLTDRRIDHVCLQCFKKIDGTHVCATLATQCISIRYGFTRWLFFSHTHTHTHPIFRSLSTHCHCKCVRFTGKCCWARHDEKYVKNRTKCVHGARDSVLCITRTHMQFSLALVGCPESLVKFLIIVCFVPFALTPSLPVCSSHSTFLSCFSAFVGGRHASVHVFIIYRRLLLLLLLLPYASAPHMHLLYEHTQIRFLCSIPFHCIHFWHGLGQSINRVKTIRIDSIWPL